MRVTVVCLFLVLVLGQAAAQGGFFAGLANAVNRFNPFRPQRRPSSRPPPPSFSPANNPPPPSFSSNNAPAPSFSSNNAPAPSFSSNPAPPSFGSSSSGQLVSSGNQVVNRPPPAVQSPPPSPQSSGGRGNHQWQGRDYLLSWREGRNSFSWGQARQYCSGRGMRMISMDNPAKVQHFLQQVQADNAPYFWAGGRISSDKRNLSWENGRREGIRRGQHPWSFTGSRGAQPDGNGGEDCLAVLNNFYNDGSKFHDVGCSHKKPTVCEA